MPPPMCIRCTICYTPRARPGEAATAVMQQAKTRRLLPYSMSEADILLSATPIAGSMSMRYSPHYTTTVEELEWIGERIEVLQSTVREICEERLALG